VAVYPRDPIQPVRAWAEQRFPNIIQWTEQPAGGHFPAMEQPELFVADLWAFHRKLR
jgi:microsomal epoxide hydrolase